MIVNFIAIQIRWSKNTKSGQPKEIEKVKIKTELEKYVKHYMWQWDRRKKREAEKKKNVLQSMYTEMTENTGEVAGMFKCADEKNQKRVTGYIYIKVLLGSRSGQDWYERKTKTK